MATGVQYLLDVDDAYKRGRRKGALVTLALSVVVALLMVFTYSVLQRYVIVHDDYVRGQKVSDMAPATPGGRYNLLPTAC